MTVAPKSLDEPLNRLLYFSQSVVATVGSCFPILAPKFIETFNLTHEEMGRLSTVILAGAVCCVFSSPWTAVYGAKPYCMMGCALTTIGFFFEAFVPSYTLLALALFCGGVGVGLLDIINSPAVAALNPTNRVASLAYLHSFFAIGQVASSALCTLYVTSGVSCRVAAILFAPIPAILGILLFRRTFPSLTAPTETESPNSKEGTGGEQPWSVILRNPMFGGCAFLLFLAASVQGGVTVWLPTYSKIVLSMSDTVSSFSLVIFAVLMGLSRVLAGRFSHVAKPLTLVGVEGLLGALLIFVATISPSMGFVAYFAGACVGFSIGASWPVVLGVASTALPNGGAKMFAALSIWGYLGGSVMPWLIGVISDSSGALLVGFRAVAIPSLLMTGAAVALGHVAGRRVVEAVNDREVDATSNGHNMTTASAASSPNDASPIQDPSAAEAVQSLVKQEVEPTKGS